MKKTAKIFYVVVCLAICLVPLVCMTFAKSDATLEKRQLAEFPSLVEDGKFNYDILEQLGLYFEDHFAFRQQYVAADALMLDLFGDSSVSTVIRGTDDWLYYYSSLDDWAGSNTISERYAFNVANNLAVTEKYVNARNAQFVYTVAPNKNTLYGEHMPYYYLPVDDVSNMDLIVPLLKDLNVSYADLFTPLSQSEEVLYLQRDSHWNNKGAVMAYNTIMDFIGKKHDDLSNIPYRKTETEFGDLGNMLYSVAAKPEWNFYYELEQKYTYKTPTQSVEDPFIQTENPTGEGSLLMFRDSFTNAMLPLFANTYQTAYFSKTQPYSFDYLMQQQKPDTVIIEVGERGAMVLGYEPPLLTGPVTELTGEVEGAGANNCTISCQTYKNDGNFLTVTGEIVGYPEYTNVYVCVNGVYYEAFTVTDTETGNDYNYLLYFNKQLLEDAPTMQVGVVVKTNGKYILVREDVFNTTEV